MGKKYQGVAVDSSARFCEILLEQYFVATVPGEEFGHPGYVRLSFAIDSKRFDQAMDRVIEMMANFH